MKIALIAHDKKKDLMIDFAKNNELFLSKHTLYATGTTGKLIIENTKLNIKLLSNELGTELGSFLLV